MMKNEHERNAYREYVLDSESKYAIVASFIFGIPMYAIFVSISIGTGNLYMISFAGILSVFHLSMLAVGYVNANRRIRIEGYRICIISGRKSVLPDTDLRQFRYVYLLNIKWLYMGKHRIGDSWTEENWVSIPYCVFSCTELDPCVMEELALLLRKKRPNGEVKFGIAFDRRRDYFEAVYNARAENAVVLEQTITLSSR